MQTASGVTRQDDAQDAVPAPASGEVEPPKRKRRRWVRRHMPEEVNQILRDYDAGHNVEVIAERHGVSKATLYRWIDEFEGQQTVDKDPGAMRMRIAVLEKTVLQLSALVAELRDEGAASADPSPSEAAHVAG